MSCPRMGISMPRQRATCTLVPIGPRLRPGRREAAERGSGLSSRPVRAARWAEAERQLQKKNYKLSRQLWRTFISRYPGDAKLPAANFQVGLTFFSERDYKSALGQFYRIIQEFSEDPIVSDALYYSGLGFAKLGQCKNATAYFEALLRPKSGASPQYQKAAKEQIDTLKKDTGDLCFDREDANAGAAAKRGVQESEAKAVAPVRTPAKPGKTK